MAAQQKKIDRQEYNWIQSAHPYIIGCSIRLHEESLNKCSFIVCKQLFLDNLGRTLDGDKNNAWNIHVDWYSWKELNYSIHIFSHFEKIFRDPKIKVYAHEVWYHLFVCNKVIPLNIKKYIWYESLIYFSRYLKLPGNVVICITSGKKHYPVIYSTLQEIWLLKCILIS